MYYQQDKVLYQFLQNEKLAADGLDLRTETERFLAQLRSGLKQEQANLRMLPSYIELKEDVPCQSKVIVMDAGGTNLRLALVHLNEAREAVIESFSTQLMPGIAERLSKERFFDALAEYLLPLLPESRRLGLCFSFAVQMQANRDGKILGFSKEIKVDGAEGALIGEELRAALRRAGDSGVLELCVLNDTSATLLGGMLQHPGRAFEAYVGFILGTGTNTAYVERCEQIEKLDEAYEVQAGALMVMNTESASYQLASRAPIEAAFDASTQTPGDNQFEKLLSGRYKGTLLWRILHCASEAGLFSLEFCKRLPSLELQPELESRELNEFLANAYGEGRLASLCAEDLDRQRVFGLIENLEERSARLICVNWAAILEQMGKGRNPLKPVAFTLEGSTYFKSPWFKRRLDYYVEHYIRADLGYHIELLASQNSNLLGAAAAILCN